MTYREQYNTILNELKQINTIAVQSIITKTGTNISQKIFDKLFTLETALKPIENNYLGQVDELSDEQTAVRDILGFTLTTKYNCLAAKELSQQQPLDAITMRFEYIEQHPVFGKTSSQVLIDLPDLYKATNPKALTAQLIQVDSYYESQFGFITNVDEFTTFLTQHTIKN